MVLSYYFLMFSVGTLVMAFLATAVYFGLMAVYGTTTHKDLTGWGPRLMMALVAVGALFGSDRHGRQPRGCALRLWLRRLGALLRHRSGGVYAAHRLRYPQKLRPFMNAYYPGDTAYPERKNQRPATPSWPLAQASIYGALTLYLDFINIFLYVVRLLGMNSRSRNN